MSVIKDEEITAWVTKYALTFGISKVRARVINPTMIAFGPRSSNYAHGKDWHRTPEEAIARAEQMRHMKIQSLRNSEAKLEKMTFDLPTEYSE